MPEEVKNARGSTYRKYKRRHLRGGKSTYKKYKRRQRKHPQKMQEVVKNARALIKNIRGSTYKKYKRRHLQKIKNARGSIVKISCFFEKWFCIKTQKNAVYL
jgi:hypothetical protein